MLGISGTGSPGGDDTAIQAFIEQTGVTFPIVYDTADTYYDFDRSTATAPYPVDVIIDADGVIRYLATDYDPDAMTAVIDALLAE